MAHQLIPNVGTLLLVALLLVTVGPSLASPDHTPSAPSTSLISYQGYLTNDSGIPITGQVDIVFRVYDVSDGGGPLWVEPWTDANSVQVSDGLFNVMLGSINPTLASAIEGYDELYLGITVGTDSEMVPRAQLGSVPFSMQSMTVADGSITTEKIADEAVTTAKLNVDNRLTVKGDNGSLLVLEAQQAASTNWIDFYNDGPSGDRSGIVGFASNNTDFEIFNAEPNGTMKFAVWGPTTAQFINASGDVGIGTINPTAKLHVNGDFVANGSKSSIVNTPHYSQRKLYAVESPEVRFVDEGLAQLERGMVRVHLDPVFLETIEDEYLVHT